MHREAAGDPYGAHGFTLLELLVVVAIIALLASYIGPRYFSQFERSELQVAHAQIGAFEKALDQFRLDVGRYPSSNEGLQTLIEKPPRARVWHGPYMKSIPLDPWGAPYQYSGSDNDFRLASKGKNGLAESAD